MTIKKADRLAKEEQFQNVNNCPTSVCCGVHHIINQKKYEECKKCKVCPKYIEYKRQGRQDLGDVRFHYVDSFRECTLYTMDMPAKTKKVSDENPKSNIKHVSKKASKDILAAEAYMRFEKNYPELLTFITWGELFIVCILDRIIKDMDKEVRSSKLYKRENKMAYNRFWDKYKIYMGNIKRQCFVNDDDQVLDTFVDSISTDFFKFRVAIENYINKFKVENSFVMSHLLLANQIINEVENIHRENVYNIKLKEPNATICNFMSPKILMDSMDSLILQFGRHEGNPRNIDLNKDINIVNGIKVLHNKVRNPYIITEIIYKVTEYHKNLNKNK